MTKGISEDQYEKELESLVDALTENAEYLTQEGDFTSEKEAIVELCSGSNYHDWFGFDHGGLYGSVIEHSDVDPHTYSDWTDPIESEGPQKTLKYLACTVMEAEAMSKALDRVGEE